MNKNYIDLEKEAFSQIPNKASNVFKLDSIHLEKLLEISQYSLMAFFLALVVSNYINGLMIKASKDMIQLATIIEDADDISTTVKKFMWANCKACHSKYRAPH